LLRVKKCHGMDPIRDKNANIHRSSSLEVFLIAVVLLLSGAAIFWNKMADTESGTKSAVAVIYVNDEIVNIIDLNNDKYLDLLNGKMRIEVKASRIRVARSDCPKQICVNTGWIKSPREVIVCVPYRVLIEIKAPETPFLDAVVR
jgi:hypothetical protein